MTETNLLRTKLSTAWLLALLCACQDAAPPQPAAAEIQTGYWQAYITLPGGNIETGLEISRDGDAYQASLINGQERVRIDDVSFTDNELRLLFPAFNTEIRAQLTDSNDRIEGELTAVKRYGVTQSMPFFAIYGSEALTESSAAPSTDLSGRWAVTFHGDQQDDSSYIGEFAQRGARLFGTFLHPNGDYRFLAGHVRGNNFHLSTFDGSHIQLFSGEVDNDGAIVNADFWSGTGWHQQWSGERNENAKLPDAFSRTFLNPGYDRFEFEFPNELGVMVSIDDEKYRDKVLIVALAGTWCPNCNDEARFLAPFYEEYRDQGLEIVTLLFEHLEDADLAAQQAKRFREKFDIQYDTLIAGISDKTEAAKTLPSLSAVLAFPTTIFMDRSGQVRHIHTGFVGPGTGDHYVQLQKDYTELTTALLAEPAGGGVSEEQQDAPETDAMVDGEIIQEN